LRTCTKCKQEKPTTDFSVRKNRKSGFKSWCKSCESKSVIERRDLQKWNEYQRQYYQQNRFIYIQNANKRHRIKKQSCLKLDEFNTLWMEELYDLAQRRTIITKIRWDIDHIIPLQTASCEEDIVRLNHYSNLQPLCSKLNREIKRENYEMSI